MIDQYSAHCLSSYSEELRAIPPHRLALLGELQVHLVDQRRGLKCVTGIFVAHRSFRDAVQLIVNEWNEPIRGGAIAAAPCIEELRQIRI
jgi:hypothetical protein